MDLKIDPEFAGKIPPLTDEEYRQLEENILEEGSVINPLIIWNGVIVDGHNRYRIVQKHPEIPYQTYEKEFPDRYAVIAWICKNQLGRRNLTPEQRKYLIGKQYEAEKASIPNITGRNQFSEQVSGQNDHQPVSEKTSQRIAKEVGASERFVRRAEEFAHGVDMAEEVSPGIKDEILSGKLKGSDQAVRAIGKAKPEQRKKLTRELQDPSPASKMKRSQTCPDPGANPDSSGATARAGEIDGGTGKEDTLRSVAGEARRTKAEELQAIQEISDNLLTSDGQGTAEDMLYELQDALHMLTDRWDLCFVTYKGIYRKKKYHRQVKALAWEGMEYLNKIRKEPDDENG
ncbi:MAG: hypothetical protein J6I76_08850 [Oribacterium sp.]|nr:hypothetical protein [Clostridia bacterium]MBO6267754.1 hypothetical protein [Clostridium sp.]MBP3803991.1 hypothetical protein [Oribacterium sp.]